MVDCPEECSLSLSGQMSYTQQEEWAGCSGDLQVATDGGRPEGLPYIVGLGGEPGATALPRRSPASPQWWLQAGAREGRPYGTEQRLAAAGSSSGSEDPDLHWVNEEIVRLPDARGNPYNGGVFSAVVLPACGGGGLK